MGACWGVVQFADWVVNRYVLSPLIVELCLYLCLLLLPAVLLLAYYRGEPGATPWTRAEKLGIPLNLVAAAGVTFALFHGKDLGAATAVVTVGDAEGRSAQREVPKTAFRKHLALFFFDNESGDPKLNWLGQGITLALETDLSQELFMDAAGAYQFIEKLKRAGLNQDSRVPLALKQEIARARHLENMVTGSFRKEKDQFAIKMDVYTTQQAKRVAEHTFHGADLMQLVDEMSVQLKRDVGVPSARIDAATDLPVAEITTRSLPALEAMIGGANVVSFKNDWASGIQLLERALNEDPSFALAAFQLFSVAIISNRVDKIRPAMELTRQNEFKLPERSRFLFNYLQYKLVEKQPEKALNVLRQWITLYPEDTTAHATMGGFYSTRGQLEEAIAALDHAYQLDPQQYGTVSALVALNSRLGHFDKALPYLQRYIREFPKEALAYRQTADTYVAMARYDQARSFYEQALARDPDDIESLLGLSEAQMRTGEIAKASETCQQALRSSRTPQDRSRVHARLKDHYVIAARWKKALEEHDALVEELLKYELPVRVLQVELDPMEIEIQVKGGAEKRVFERLKKAERELALGGETSIYSLAAEIGYAALYAEIGQPAKAAEALRQVETSMRSYSAESGRRFALRCQGKVKELEGAFDQAIDAYEQSLRLEPISVRSRVSLGRCLLHQNQLKKAEATLKRALELYPAHPEAHGELALVYERLGDRAQAQAQVRAALGGWADADPDDKEAAAARALAVRVDHR